MYADLYKYLSSESADGVGEYVVYWLAVVATVGGGHLWLLHRIIFGNSVEIFICCYSFEIYI